MRAMILAAGLGTRMQPLSALRPKPALPVRGVPVIARLFALLVANGVTQVMVNLHSLADTLRSTARAWCPPELELFFSEESELLGTGGGISRAEAFLRDSNPSLVLAGDMLLDVDLARFAAEHLDRGAAATLLLRKDPRSQTFGSIGTDADGNVRRIGGDFDLGGATAEGLFVGVRAFSPRCFDTLPHAGDAFEDLRDWLAIDLRERRQTVRAEALPPEQLGWEPIGTPAEYLRANLTFDPRFALNAPTPLADGTRIEPGLIIGRAATLEPGARLERAVIWDGEHVPAGLHVSDGVFAGGHFHRVSPERTPGANGT